MNTVRLNITVPVDIGRHLKGLKNVSAFIVEVLRERFRREEREEMERKLEQAYRQSAQDERELNQDWDATAGDGL